MKDFEFSGIVVSKEVGKAVIEVGNGELIAFTDFVQTIENLIPIKDIQEIYPDLSKEKIGGAFRYIKELAKMNYLRPEMREVSGDVKQAVDKNLDELDKKLSSVV
jgi:uncharacterized protein (DUF433 family)